jgi:hypothetical protein
MPLITVWDLVYNPSLKKLIAGTYAKSIQSIDVSSLITGVRESVSDPSNHVSLYPNPIQSGWLHVSFASEFEPELIQIYSADGKKVEASLEYKNNEILVSSKQLPSGLYFIQLKSKEKNLMKRFVKL